MTKMILAILGTAIVALSLIYMVPASTYLLLPLQWDKSAYAQTVPQDNTTGTNTGTSNASSTTNTTGDLASLVHPDVDASPIAAVIIIGEDMQGNVTYMPSSATVRVGEEVLIINNSTGSQSMTNGMGPDDPLAGTLFDTGPIPSRGFAEYVASNLSPGEYPFHSTNSTSTKGVLIVEPNG
jgi:plastocyanin